MTFHFDYCWMFATGLVIALLTDALRFPRRVAVAIWIGGVVFAALCAYLAYWLYTVVGGEFMLTYLVDSPTVTPTVMVVLISLYFPCYLTGLGLGRSLLAAGRGRVAAALFLGFLVAWFLTFTLLIPRRFFFVADSTVNWELGVGSWWWEMSGTAPLGGITIDLGWFFSALLWTVVVGFPIGIVTGGVLLYHYRDPSTGDRLVTNR